MNATLWKDVGNEECVILCGKYGLIHIPCMRNLIFMASSSAVVVKRVEKKGNDEMRRSSDGIERRLTSNTEHE